MTITAPKGNFLVVAQLTEETSPGHGKGHRYNVMAHEDHVAGETGRGVFCTTIEQARNRIAADIKIMSRRSDESGLIDWGTMAAREYAIFPVTFGDEVK